MCHQSMLPRASKQAEKLSWQPDSLRRLRARRRRRLQLLHSRRRRRGLLLAKRGSQGGRQRRRRRGPTVAIWEHAAGDILHGGRHEGGTRVCVCVVCACVCVCVVCGCLRHARRAHATWPVRERRQARLIHPCSPIQGNPSMATPCMRIATRPPTHLCSLFGISHLSILPRPRPCCHWRRRCRTGRRWRNCAVELLRRLLWPLRLLPLLLLRAHCCRLRLLPQRRLPPWQHWQRRQRRRRLAGGWRRRRIQDHFLLLLILLHILHRCLRC